MSRWLIEASRAITLPSILEFALDSKNRKDKQDRELGQADTKANEENRSNLDAYFIIEGLRTILD